MYFQYENLGKINGYGMISELNPETKGFAHREMWVDTPDETKLRFHVTLLLINESLSCYYEK